jgi:hypothetical protein
MATYSAERLNIVLERTKDGGDSLAAILSITKSTLRIDANSGIDCCAIGIEAAALVGHDRGFAASVGIDATAVFAGDDERGQ